MFLHPYIEMAIVLLIVSICAFVSVANSTELMKQQATDAFIEQFVTDLYFAQQQAMANSQTVHVHVQTEAVFTKGELQCLSWEHWRNRERFVCLELP